MPETCASQLRMEHHMSSASCRLDSYRRHLRAHLRAHLSSYLCSQQLLQSLSQALLVSYLVTSVNSEVTILNFAITASSTLVAKPSYRIPWVRLV